MAVDEANAALLRAIEFVDQNNFTAALDLLADKGVAQNALSDTMARCLLSLISLGMKAPSNEGFAFALSQLLGAAEHIVGNLKAASGAKCAH